MKIKRGRDVVYMLFFDLETSGLPQQNDRRQNYPPHMIEKYDSCRIVQFTWSIYEYKKEGLDKKFLKKENLIIKPDNFKISEISTQIHGISNERARDEGISIHTAFKKLNKQMIKFNVDKIIAYNINFDINVLLSELYRYNYPNLIERINDSRHVCAMLMAHWYINKGIGKWPKLGEMYKFLFKQEMEGAHDAYFDVKATVKCYFRLKKMKFRGMFEHI
jgi:DNA polymerase-3 subunit alpha